jgi:hypothetical protein
VKFNKQGLPDLSDKPVNTRKRCIHLPGPTEIVGTRYVRCFGILERETVYGSRCVWCHVVVRTDE